MDTPLRLPRSSYGVAIALIICHSLLMLVIDPPGIRGKRRAALHLGTFDSGLYHGRQVNHAVGQTANGPTRERIARAFVVSP